MPWWNRVKAAAGRLLEGIDRLEEQARESSPEADARRLAREGQDGPRDLSVPGAVEVDVVELEELDLDPVGAPQEIVLDELTDPSVGPSSLDSLVGADSEEEEDLTELGLPSSARRVASLRDLPAADEIPLGHVELDEEDELEPTVLDGERAELLRSMARASDMGLVEAETRHEGDDAQLAQLVEGASLDEAEDTWQWETPPVVVEEPDPEAEEITEDEVEVYVAELTEVEVEVEVEVEPDASGEAPEPLEADTEESVEITDFSLDALVWEEDDSDPDTDIESAPPPVAPAGAAYRPRFKNSLLIADNVVAQSLRLQHYPELAHLDDGLLGRLARLDAQLLVQGERLGAWTLELLDSEEPLVEAAVLFLALRLRDGIRDQRQLAVDDPAARRRLGWSMLEHLPELQEVLGDHPFLEAGPGRLFTVLQQREQLEEHAPELADLGLPVEPRGLHALAGFTWSD
jgi:hypothetical protein